MKNTNIELKDFIKEIKKLNFTEDKEHKGTYVNHKNNHCIKVYNDNVVGLFSHWGEQVENAGRPMNILTYKYRNNLDCILYYAKMRELELETLSYNESIDFLNRLYEGKENIQHFA